MTTHIERRTVPPPPAARAEDSARSLADIMYEGFYALYLLKQGSSPRSEAGFVEMIIAFLGDVDRNAKLLAIPAEDVHAAKYAYCAAVDEIILGSDYAIRPAWVTQPLQLRLFGDQLAGQHFFDRLDGLRARGSVHLPALEVFEMCLLLGFQGKYFRESGEQLANLSARLHDEIARMHGGSRGFAPHAARPDNVINLLRQDLSIMVLATVFTLAAACAYIGFNMSLKHEARAALAGYHGVIKMPPPVANVTITLP